jgi:hypothetical protein
MATQPVNNSSILGKIGENVTNIQNSVSKGINEFYSPTNAPAPAAIAETGFYDSNGIIAKFAFLVLVIILFLILLNLGIGLISYFLSSPKRVYIINGMIDGNNMKIISQDPKVNNSPIIYRSNNEITGIEFTWSVWLRLDGLSPSNMYQPIFVKGNSTYNSQGVSSISNGPGVYFSGNSNNSLRIMMDTVSRPSANEKTPSTEIIDISNIPLKKWFHLAVRCQNKYVDAYINGLVVYRTNLVNVPLQNYDNIQVCGNSGFNGKLSNLIYYSRALNIVDINGLVSSGPNTKNADPGLGNFGTNYLSTQWYKM